MLLELTALFTVGRTCSFGYGVVGAKVGSLLSHQFAGYWVNIFTILGYNRGTKRKDEG
jgi:hypothetical protein